MDNPAVSETLFRYCRSRNAAPPPAFCAFKDMNHFEELLVLGD